MCVCVCVCECFCVFVHTWTDVTALLCPRRNLTQVPVDTSHWYKHPSLHKQRNSRRAHTTSCTPPLYSGYTPHTETYTLCTHAHLAPTMRWLLSRHMAVMVVSSITPQSCKLQHTIGLRSVMSHMWSPPTTVAVTRSRLDFCKKTRT